MSEALDIRAVVRAAQERGYFDLGLLSGHSVSPDQLRELYSALSKRKIPREPPSSSEPPGELNRATALTIMNALRTGTVPMCDLSSLSVGRRSLRNRLTADLQAVSRGQALVRFLNAGYGSGKTHSLWMLAEVAFREHFAVSFVTLSPQSCPLYSLLDVYGAVVDGVHTSDSKNARGLDRLLGRWIEVLQVEGRESAERRVRQLAPHIVAALAQYADATLNPVRPDPAKAAAILAYLSGRKSLIRDLRALGISQQITEDTALTTLTDLTRLVRDLGFRGLCVFFDEAESALSFGTIRTAQAFQNLYRLVQKAPNLPNCYFIYATTPSFFDTYRDYWPEGKPIADSHIYALEPLSLDEYVELAGNICAISSRAYDWNAPHEKVRQLVGPLVNETRDVGRFVRSLMAVLDRSRRG